MDLILPGTFGNPPYLIWLTSARCNARCAHCFHAERSDRALPDELTTGEAIRFFDRYGPLTYLTLGGGEPSLREDLPEVVERAAKRCGLRFLNYVSNGFLPDQLSKHGDSIARSAPETVTTITISIDGLFEAHDQRRKVKGGFDRVLDSILRLKEIAARRKNLRISTNTVWMPCNKDEIDEIHRYIVDELGLPHKLILFRDPRNWKTVAPGVDVGEYVTKARAVEESTDTRLGGGWGIMQNLRRALDHARLDVLADISSGQDLAWSCMAGRSGVVLSEGGELLPCEPLGRSFGNVRETDFSAAALLRRAAARGVLREVAGCRCVWECQLRASLPYQARMIPRLLRLWVGRIRSGPAGGR
ncbi:MAG: radical SAM protein [Deferrisomatales bacterium]